MKLTCILRSLLPLLQVVKHYPSRALWWSCSQAWSQTAPRSTERVMMMTPMSSVSWIGRSPWTNRTLWVLTSRNTMTRSRPRTSDARSQTISWSTRRTTTATMRRTVSSRSAKRLISSSSCLWGTSWTMHSRRTRKGGTRYSAWSSTTCTRDWNCSLPKTS